MNFHRVPVEKLAIDWNHTSTQQLIIDKIDKHFEWYCLEKKGAPYKFIHPQGHHKCHRTVKLPRAFVDQLRAFAAMHGVSL